MLFRSATFYRVDVLQVAEGQEICVIEAMKMQNSMTAARTAKVTLTSPMTTLSCIHLTRHLYRRRSTVEGLEPTTR